LNSEDNRTDSNELSRDSLFDGELICYQHCKGYRFSVDALLLAHFVDVRAGDRILDLGAGSSIIGLLLLYRHHRYIKELCGIEMQYGLAELSRKNLCENGFKEKAKVVQGDIRGISALVAPESYDTVVCNPPFYPTGSGRKNLAEQARIARHQTAGGLDDFLGASRLAVKNRGCVYFIYPAEQICEFIHCAPNHRLQVKRIQLIYSYPDTSNSARLALFQCVKNGGAGAEVLPPFYMYEEKNGAYTPAMENLYARNSAQCHIASR
jgi:tRNA1Val (adenine37-N6)-methyltransferase